MQGNTRGNDTSCNSVATRCEKGEKALLVCIVHTVAVFYICRMSVFAKHPNKNTRLIIEAAAIAEGSCVSKPSIALSEKKL